MNNKIDKKKLYARANKYSRTLKGVEIISICDDADNDFFWHGRILSSIYGGVVEPNYTISLSDGRVDSIFRLDIRSALNGILYIPFEGMVFIKIDVLNFLEFLRGFEEDGVVLDVAFYLLDPNRLIVFDEGEYDIYIYDVSE